MAGAAPSYVWSDAEKRAHEVLIAHQHKSTSAACICGEFGNKPSDLGRSHAEHVLEQLAAAHLLIVAVPQRYIDLGARLR